MGIYQPCLRFLPEGQTNNIQSFSWILDFEPGIEIVLSIEISLRVKCTNITMSCALDLIMTPYSTYFMSATSFSDFWSCLPLLNLQVTVIQRGGSLVEVQKN